jgi:carbonic anhydrase
MPKLAVLACMDARIDVWKVPGLQKETAHVIRNAGGLVTEDAIRSLAISQQLLGTEEIVLIHHTDCGMLKFTDDELAERLESETGERPAWQGLAFTDLEDSIRAQMREIASSRFLSRTARVRGFIYDVETHDLREVPAETAQEAQAKRSGRSG